MRGQDVRVLQDFLRKVGQTVSIDGHFGSSTLKAVMAFEQAATRTADGVMDAADIDALRAMAASGVPAAQPVVAPAGEKATIGPDGLAIAPASAPEQVKQIIAAGNQIATNAVQVRRRPRKLEDTGYDCSGSVSYALHGVPGLLEAPLPSGGFIGLGRAGPRAVGDVYAKASHMYMVVAGLRFDTSGRTKNNTRWQTELRSTAATPSDTPPDCRSRPSPRPRGVGAARPVGNPVAPAGVDRGGGEPTTSERGRAHRASAPRRPGRL